MNVEPRVCKHPIRKIYNPVMYLFSWLVALKTSVDTSLTLTKQSRTSREVAFVVLLQVASAGLVQCLAER